MADKNKAIKVNDIYTNLLDPSTGQSVNYKVVTEWWDGSLMDDTKADGELYRKVGNDYVRKVIDKEGELFLEKDTMAEMRNLSSLEVLMLKAEIYRGVTLNGYYEKGDTPKPINYYLSETVEEDDGGSVIEVSDIKIEHDFNLQIDSRYFGTIAGSLNENKNTEALISCVNYAKKTALSTVFIGTKGTMYVNKTIVLDSPITIKGYHKSINNGYAPRIYCPNLPEGDALFDVSYSTVVIKNILIHGRGKENGTIGIRHNGGNYCDFETIGCFGFDTGILFQPDGNSGSTFFSRIIRPRMSGCRIGIHIAEPLVSTRYNNAISILSPSITGGKDEGEYAIVYEEGTGSVMEFEGTEVSGGNPATILLTGGNVELKGSGWFEVSEGYTVLATGGYHIVTGNLFAGDGIVEDGGTVMSYSPQYRSTTQKNALPWSNAYFWFSFDEGKGKYCYSRVNDNIISITDNSYFENRGKFTTALATEKANSLIINDISKINLQEDWTLVMNMSFREEGITSIQSIIRFNFKDDITSNIDYMLFRTSFAGFYRIYPEEILEEDGWGTSLERPERGDIGNPQKNNWFILSYDSTEQKIFGISNSGRQRLKRGITMPTEELESISFGTSVISVDEFMMFDKVLDANEVFNITSIPYLERNTNRPKNNKISISANYGLKPFEKVITIDSDTSTTITLPDKDSYEVGNNDSIEIINKQGNEVTVLSDDNEEVYRGNEDITLYLIEEDWDYKVAKSTNIEGLDLDDFKNESADPFVRESEMSDAAGEVVKHDSSYRLKDLDESNIQNQSAINLSFGPISGEEFGSRSVSIGVQSVASGPNSIAIGRSARTGSPESAGSGGVAIGRDAKAGTNSVAIGFNADAYLSETFALGTNSSATGARGFAMGQNAAATGSRSIAIGFNSESNGNYTNSIGEGAGSGSTSRAGNFFGRDAGAHAKGDYVNVFGENSYSLEGNGTYHRVNIFGSNLQPTKSDQNIISGEEFLMPNSTPQTILDAGDKSLVTVETVKSMINITPSVIALMHGEAEEDIYPVMPNLQWNVTIQSIVLVSRDTVTGSNLEARILINDTPQQGADLIIPANSRASNEINQIDWDAGQNIDLEVTQTGSTDAGSNLALYIFYSLRS